MFNQLLSLNYASIGLGTTYLVLVNALLLHWGVLHRYWVSAINHDKNITNWFENRIMTRKFEETVTHQVIEAIVYAIQTFFVMGIMNLADVDCTTHAVQLGLFLFIAYHVPDIYRAYIWEGRPQEMIIIKAVRGLLTTAGLTALLHRLGTAIY